MDQKTNPDTNDGDDAGRETEKIAGSESGKPESTGTEAKEAGEPEGADTSEKDDAEDQKDGVERLAARLKSIVSIFTSAVILAAVPIICIVGFLQTRENVVLIDPIEIPKELKDAGYTSNSVAQRLSSELDEIERRSQQRNNRKLLTPAWTKSDIQVPVSGLSIESVIRFLGEPFGYEEQHVAGELISASSPGGAELSGSGEAKSSDNDSDRKIQVAPERRRYQLVLRLTGADDAPDVGTSKSSSDIDDVFKNGAINIAGMINPYMLASYYFQIEFKDRKFEETRRWIKYCILYRPNDDKLRALALWGTLLNEQGNLAEAIDKYKQALDYGDSSEVRLGWADAAAELGDKTTAIDNYKRAIALNASAPQAYNGLGNVLKDLGRTKEAEEQYKEAIRRDPSYIWAYLNLADAFTDAEDIDKASEYYDRGARLAETQSYALDPRIGGHEPDASTEVLDQWGRALMGQGRVDEAIRKFQDSLGVDRFDYVAVSSIGDAYLQKADYRSGIDAYRQVINLRPSYGFADESLAAALLWSGRFDDADREFRKVQSKGELSAWSMVNWAEDLQNKGDLGAALDLLEAAHRNGADFPAYYRHHAAVLSALGKTQFAEEEVRLGLGRFPSDAQSYLLLGDLLSSGTDQVPAKQAYGQAVRIATLTVRGSSKRNYGYNWIIASNEEALVAAQGRLGHTASARSELVSARRLAIRLWYLDIDEALLDDADENMTSEEASLESAIEDSYGHPDAIGSLAQFFENQNQCEKAIPLYQRVISINPHSDSASGGLERCKQIHTTTQ